MAYIDDVYLVVNIAPVGIPTYVRLSQNENGRRLYFAVAGGEIPSGSTATMSGTKPDGVVYSKAGTVSGNTVTFSEDIQLTAVAGEWPAKIVIVNGGQTVMTARIRFVIDADTVAAGAVPSDSQLEGLVAQAAAYAEAAKDGAFYGSPLVASTVAEMTDQTRVYVYTGSESGYTSGNWYYWDGSAWTSGGVYNATAVSTDTTLSIAGKAADAKATGDAIAAVTIPTDKTLTQSDEPADAKVVGDEIADLKDDLSDTKSRIAEGVNYNLDVLIECFKHVPWLDDKAQELLGQFRYIEDVPEVVKLDAYLSNLDTSIVVGGDVETLRPYLTVTATYEDSTSVVITGYSLNGNLVDGTNVVNVSYGGIISPVYLYLPVNNSDGILYDLPQNTTVLKAKGGLNTGVMIDNTDADYTVLGRFTDTNILSTGDAEQLRFVDGSRTPSSIQYAKGVNVYANPTNGAKKYTVFLDAKTVVSGELSNSSHEIIFAVRRSLTGANATITLSLFIDGTKISTATFARNTVYNGTTHTKPIGLGRVLDSQENINPRADMTVNLFRIYNRALTDSEINTILGVTI